MGSADSTYKSLNTANLPAPDIKDGGKHFNTVLYTGDGSYPRAVTGAGFSPDWVWLKSRSDALGHGTYDRVRGVGTSATSLRIDQAVPEGDPAIAPYIDLDSLDSDGFTLGNTVSSAELFNLSTKGYVAWCWKADNTSGSSNTAGSITSTVSANPSAGFSIVSYTGTGTAGTVGHGLGVAPSFYVVKNRDGAYFWPCYHASLTNPATTYIGLNETAAQQTGETHWNSTAPTSTVFSVNTQLSVNNSGDDYIAYCFAEVEGYSKFGSYTGNGSTDGVFIHLGFKPKFFLLKATSVDLESWSIFDSARDPDNFVNRRIMPNNANQEEEYPNSGQATMDFLANGVKLRASNTAMNGSGVTYIYAAFAEHPLGGSGVSPATAR
jgi:hypothetical protein